MTATTVPQSETRVKRGYYLHTLSGDAVRVTGMEIITVGIRETERFENWCRTSDGLLVHQSNLEPIR